MPELWQFDRNTYARRGGTIGVISKGNNGEYSTPARGTVSSPSPTSRPGAHIKHLGSSPNHTRQGSEDLLLLICHTQRVEVLTMGVHLSYAP